ncbi:hypothetical protein ScPMuIL_000975, partial [Solemya velum]
MHLQLSEVWAEKVIGPAAVIIPLAVAFSVYGSANGSVFQNGRVFHRKWRRTCKGILIAPDWSTQTWYLLLLQLQQCPPLKLQRTAELLSLPQKSVQHPLGKKLKLYAWHIFGKGL